MSSIEGLWVGVGCKRGTSAVLIQFALQSACDCARISWTAIAGLATLERKRTEAGLLEVSQIHRWPIAYFTAAELKNCPIPHPSSALESIVGTPSVAEAAALSAAANSGQLKSAVLILPKQIFRLPQEPGAVTLAIAQHVPIPTRPQRIT
ncbi:MAG: cobalamin biosynthesis protein [Thermosynechococcaceae cyanobacterium MS004]|nr:cobalamin biosynthesis protein [Thermosynechococcaceae cyanobacterium MS004]